jgi:hypothetical protein
VENGASLLDRIAVLALAATVHAVAYVVGLLVIRRYERGESLLEDARDRAIGAHATRAAHFVLPAGVVVEGMIMPFNRGGDEPGPFLGVPRPLP